MPWDPKIYNQFKNIRFQPFFDLAELIVPEVQMKCIDLGCGTGEQTALLVEKFPEASFVGIDASSEMLSASKKLETDRLRFEKSTTEEVLAKNEGWDLIFSNAALQWSDQHTVLFPKIISKLHTNGQLAVQMPYQPENRLNQLLYDLAMEPPFNTYLNGWNRPSSVLSIDDYGQLFFENGMGNLRLSLRVYPIIATDASTLFDFISGSALIPYLEKLDLKQQLLFTEAFKQRITDAFYKFPVFYAFKRLLLYGRKQ